MDQILLQLPLRVHLVELQLKSIDLGLKSLRFIFLLLDQNDLLPDSAILFEQKSVLLLNRYALELLPVGFVFEQLNLFDPFSVVRLRILQQMVLLNHFL